MKNMQHISFRRSFFFVCVLSLIVAFSIGCGGGELSDDDMGYGDTEDVAAAELALGIDLPNGALVSVFIDGQTSTGVTGTVESNVDAVKSHFQSKMSALGATESRPWNQFTAGGPMSALYRVDGRTWSFGLTDEGVRTRFDIQKQK